MTRTIGILSYRRRVRETIYTGLAHRNPILLTWEERIVEDERVVFEQIRKAVDWSQQFQRPPVAIRVDQKLMPVSGRRPLFRYEEALSRMPVEAFYVWEDDPVPPGTMATIDAREPFVAPAFVSDGGTLPDELKTHLPLALPAGWAASYSWSDDRRVLLAFLRRRDATDFAGSEHRWSPSGSALELQNFPDEGLSFRLFNLAIKKAVVEGRFHKRLKLKVPQEGKHFFLLVRPNPGPMLKEDHERQDPTDARHRPLPSRMG